MANELETRGTGRRALVTGGGVRVGRAISLALGRAGYRVGVHYRTSQADAASTVRDLKRMGGQPQAFRADLSKPAEIGQMFEVFNDSTYKGRIRITSVSEDLCIGAIELRVDGTKIETGDKTTSRL